MATVSMVTRHLLDRKGAAIADETLYGWVNAFSALLDQLGHRLEIMQEGTGWRKALPGGEPICAVPEDDPYAPFLPAVSQNLWEHSAGVSLAIYADPLLVYPQAHAASVALGWSLPLPDLPEDTSTGQWREEWLERIKSGLSTVHCVVANNSQFIQWAVSTWPGISHKLHYIPDWFDSAALAAGGSTPDEDPGDSARPQIIFACPALPRFGISETLRAVDVLRRRYDEFNFSFCGTVPEPTREQMERWFGDRPRCLLLPPGQAMYSPGDIALFPVKSGPVPVQQVLQALRSGAAVIGSMHGPLVDMIIHSHNGLLVKPVDTDLVEALGVLMENPALGLELGGRARPAGEMMSMDIWASGWSNLIKTLIGSESDD